MIFAIGLFATIVVRAITSERPIKDAAQQEPATSNAERPSGDNEPNRPSSDFAALIDAIAAEGRAYRAEEQSEDRSKKFRDWITIGLLVATTAGIYWQISEMIKVYGPIKDGAEAAKTQAGAAAGQVTVMQGQLAEMKADRRPWLAFDDTISVVSPLVFDQDGARVTIAGSIRNGGRSIAKDIMTVQSGLVVQPLIPQGNTPIPVEKAPAFEMRGFPYQDACGVAIAKQFLGIGGSIILSGGTQRWPVSGDDHLNVPSNQFKLDSSGRSAFFWISASFIRMTRTEFTGLLSF
jgi:hypothetical protein